MGPTRKEVKLKGTVHSKDDEQLEFLLKEYRCRLHGKDFVDSTYSTRRRQLRSSTFVASYRGSLGYYGVNSGDI